MNSGSVFTGSARLIADDLRAGADVGDRHELLDRIEGQLLHLRRQVDVGRGREQQRVAVRRGGRDLAGAERAAGARTIFDHEGLAEFGGQMLRAEPRHHVGVAAGAERHDDGHRPGRPVRGVKRAGERGEDGDNRQRERQTQWTIHVIPHSWREGCFAPLDGRASRTSQRLASSGPAAIPFYKILILFQHSTRWRSAPGMVILCL